MRYFFIYLSRLAFPGAFPGYALNAGKICAVPTGLRTWIWQPTQH